MKKLPSQYTIEELMSLLDSAEEDSFDEVIQIEMEGSNDILAFTSNYKITPGDLPVSKKILYKLYRAFSSHPLTEKEFGNRLRDFVDDKGSKFFYLNQDNFAISRHLFKETRKKDLTKSLTYQKHFNWFIEAREIGPGAKWVEGYVLFYIYLTFCNERKVKPKFGYKSFHNFLKLHFKHRRVNQNRSLWFQVDHRTHDLLTQEEKDVLRDARKKETGRS